jgi:hypothetical protein
MLNAFQPLRPFKYQWPAVFGLSFLGKLFKEAALDLNFARTKTLDSRITFTRASSATYFDADGVMQTAGNNVARFDHDPATGESLGLLVEEARTNAALRSTNEFTTAPWSQGGTAANLTSLWEIPSSEPSPIGEPAALWMEHDEDSKWQGITQDIDLAVTGGNWYTVSVYTKKANRSRLGFRIRNRTGTTRQLEGAFSYDEADWVACDDGTGLVEAINNNHRVHFVQELANDWFRIGISFKPVENDTGFVIRLQPLDTESCASQSTYDGAGVPGLYLAGFQLEAGAFPTSYIPTTDAQVTRAADVAVMTGTNFSDWFSGTAGTFFFDSDYRAIASSNERGIFLSTADAAGSSANIEPYVGAALPQSEKRVIVRYAGSGSASSEGIASTYVPVLQKSRLAISYQADGAWFAANGTEYASFNNVWTTNLGNFNAATRLGIGHQLRSGPTRYFNGTIKRLTYWPTRLPNETLEALTSD